jgi:pantoate--beta-alanine ligase
MQIIHEIAPLRAQISDWRRSGLRVGLVPTMGNLHAGHIALVRDALTRADRVVTSIFVNPLQFGLGEDLDAYPRTLEQDIALLSEVGNHALFAPSEQQVYPNGARWPNLCRGARAIGPALRCQPAGAFSRCRHRRRQAV